MVQHVYGAIRSLEEAITQLEEAKPFIRSREYEPLDEAIALVTDSVIFPLIEYAQQLLQTSESRSMDPSTYRVDDMLSAFLLFFTQQTAHRTTINNPRLLKIAGASSKEKLMQLFDFYAEQKIFVRRGLSDRNKAVSYELSPFGYQLSLRELSKRAQQDRRPASLIPLEELGLIGSVVNTLKRAGGYSTLADLLELASEHSTGTGIWNLTRIRTIGEKKVTELMEKIAYYQEREKPMPP